MKSRWWICPPATAAHDTTFPTPTVLRWQRTPLWFCDPTAPPCAVTGPASRRKNSNFTPNNTFTQKTHPQYRKPIVCRQNAVCHSKWCHSLLNVNHNESGITVNMPSLYLNVYQVGPFWLSDHRCGIIHRVQLFKFWLINCWQPLNLTNW